MNYWELVRRQRLSAHGYALKERLKFCEFAPSAASVTPICVLFGNGLTRIRVKFVTTAWPYRCLVVEARDVIVWSRMKGA